MFAKWGNYRMWLIDRSVGDVLEHARTHFTPTSEQTAKFLALHGEGLSNPSRILSIAGNNAVIAIDGVLTKIPDFFAEFFGGGNTTFGEIIAALAQAEADPVVDNITLAIDSPGGFIDGLFDTIKAIRDTSKTTKAVVSDKSASAAFALAAQADEIVAANQMSRFGSIGILTDISVREDEVTITSSKAPLKAPDVTTPEGVEVVRKQLDAIHDVFVSAIAEGRGITEEKVNSDFGRGALLVANDALSRGMIDSILDDDTGETQTEETNARTNPGQPEGNSEMLINELRTGHPETYAEALELGRAEERDRVLAHLTMGEGFGAMDIAAKAIRKGSVMTGVLQAECATAGRNADTLDNTGEDDKATAAATDDAVRATDVNAADAEADTVAAILERNRGVLVVLPTTA